LRGVLFGTTGKTGS